MLGGVGFGGCKILFSGCVGVGSRRIVLREIINFLILLDVKYYIEVGRKFWV